MPDHPSIDVDLSAKVAPAGTHWREIDELREQHRFFWNTYGPGYWVLTRFEDIREAFQSPEIFSNHSIVATDPDPPYRFLPSFIDPPEHMKYRQVMNRWFAPASVSRMAPILRRLARETVEEVAADGGCDFVATFGDRFPVKAFLVSMGLPPDRDPDFFVSCVRRMSGHFAETAEESAVAMMAAWSDVATYWKDMIADRRARPLDPDEDFVTLLTQARIDDRPLPDDEIQDICVTLTIGSLDTLKAQLGWCFYHLATHDEDRKRLVAAPEQIPSAVEELLRGYPIISMARKLTRDVDFHGCPMKRDQMVLLSIQSATRDPRIFPNADEIIIDRQPNRHIAFGASEHRCLGSHLARAELATAIEQWHEVVPDYRVGTDEALMAHGGQIALLRLPLAWDVR